MSAALKEAATRSDSHVPDLMGSVGLPLTELSSSQKHRLSISGGAPGNLKGLNGSRSQISQAQRA